ncbi:hisitidine kinase [Candidatus Methylomirabilis lanthanidiphila]|uniref:Hisitidine kinase n=1 Tax=Candidatus Methylomirabilis lanthanidiphila TaxID=2211376 RepID=A0A564ZMC1_9BACT|nr:sigma-54 dependent transcriptional regulator [Candidatus Methylomirabilis lanthanidiphila]VUZ86353.1 hisitidine kinase [Candidatus Methylomirabilis lanthanidiphila]
MSKPPRILVVDDDATARAVLAEVLMKAGYAVESAGGGAEAVEKGQRVPVDLVLTDIKMPDMDGMAVLKRFRELSPETPVILLTAFGAMESAIEAIKCGAYDYISKPFKKDDVLLTIGRALDQRRLLYENVHYRQALRDRYQFSNIIGSSQAMLEVYKLVARVADGRSTVLLHGESGTGKELIARAIHYNGPRANAPFVAVNCGALTESLLESELFGHEKGAFTGATAVKRGLFEEAGGGTILLDEVGDMSPALQAKLLRVLQEQEIRRVGGDKSIPVDVRVLASTHRDLWSMVRKQQFREDLYYRLNVVTITLPPLRDRRDDIPMLAYHFMQRCAAANQRPVVGISPDAMMILQQANWPGNVRELEHTIESAVVMTSHEIILPDDLPATLRESAPVAAAPEFPDLVTLEEMERRYLIRVLEETHGNKAQAAKILGIDRRTLYRMAERFGLNLAEG